MIDDKKEEKGRYGKEEGDKSQSVIKSERIRSDKNPHPEGDGSDLDGGDGEHGKRIDRDRNPKGINNPIVEKVPDQPVPAEEMVPIDEKLKDDPEPMEEHLDAEGSGEREMEIDSLPIKEGKKIKEGDQEDKN